VQDEALDSHPIQIFLLLSKTRCHAATQHACQRQFVRDAATTTNNINMNISGQHHGWPALVHCTCRTKAAQGYCTSRKHACDKLFHWQCTANNRQRPLCMCRDNAFKTEQLHAAFQSTCKLRCSTCRTCKYSLHMQTNSYTCRSLPLKLRSTLVKLRSTQLQLSPSDCCINACRCHHPPL
jgi:hypothetical protein